MKQELKDLNFVLDYFNDFGNLCAMTEAVLEKYPHVKIEKNDKDTITNVKKRIKKL